MTWLHSLKLWEIASEMFVFSHTIHFFLEDVLEDHEGRISICRWHRWHGKKWGWNLGPCWTSSDVEQQLKYIFRHQSQWDICRNSKKFQVHWIHHLYLRNMYIQGRFTKKNHFNENEMIQKDPWHPLHRPCKSTTGNRIPWQPLHCNQKTKNELV